jgi:excinuclease ABC subunit C
LDDGANYYGPFPNPAGLRKAMKILRKVFPFDYKKPVGKPRVSLHYHLGLSPGLEEGKTTLKDYRKNLKQLIMYMTGRRKQLVKQLESEMKLASKEQNFERAAELRNRVSALKSLRRQVVFGDREFMDMSKDKGLEELRELAGMSKPPRRIEGYDISHMSGQDTVASMVVFTYGLPEKSEYRKFKMRVPGNDDFAHMREVLSRRFSGRHLNWPKPDLILIDGGKGQLSSALSVLGQTGLDIPAIGLAKRQEQVVIKADDGFRVLSLEKDSHAIKLLIRIRDESHRFAVSYHSTLKTKRQSASILEEVPTVGPSSRKKLLKEFGGMRGIVQAREWELAKIVGPAKARLIKQCLRPHKESSP